MDKVQAMVTTLQSHTAQVTSSFRHGEPFIGNEGKGGFYFIIMVVGESLEVKAFLHKLDGGGSLNHGGPTPSLMLHNASRSRGMSDPMLTTSVGNVGR